jgi:hypothetical protein
MLIHKKINKISWKATIVALGLGSQLKLRHDKEKKKECLKTQSHSHKCQQMGKWMPTNVVCQCKYTQISCVKPSNCKNLPIM